MPINVDTAVRETDTLHSSAAVADPVILARYVDSFERTPAGWRIAHRRMFAHGLVGFPDGIVRPLSRQP